LAQAPNLLIWQEDRNSVGWVGPWALCSNAAPEHVVEVPVKSFRRGVWQVQMGWQTHDYPFHLLQVLSSPLALLL
jgi:hypothetical protein